MSCCCRRNIRGFTSWPTNGEVVATFDDRRWVFPRGDCVLLPVPNTTAEMLARYIGQQLISALRIRLAWTPQHLRIEVDECEGQLGICQWNLAT